MMAKLLVFLGFLSVGLMGAILLRSFFKDANPIRITLDRFSRLGWVNRITVLFVVVQLTMFGGAKHGGTNDVDDVASTNDVELVEGGTNDVGEAASSPLLMVGARPFTSGETPLPRFAAPYRLESVSTNSGFSYAMPVDGTTRGTWHLTGAYEDVQRIGLEGLGSLEGAAFRFPIGNQLCTSLWAYTWGKVRPQLKNASTEIAVVSAPMSAIPEVSRFWTAATSNDTYLLTWENFALGRIAIPTNASSLIPDPSSLVSAQLELKRNGDFITRSNDVECVYRRVIEPNPIGPINPPDPDDPLMPIHPYGPVQDLSVIEETNAYCWVDIVVDNADAWVRFEGDGASNLADPSFAAKAGETNHVVILIGKTYKVTCDMPFAVVGKSDPAIDEWWENDNTLWLNWPVNIWSVGDDEEPPLLLTSLGNGSPRRKGFTMFVSPSGLGGDFTWTNCCCSVSGGGYYFSYSCNGDCGCCGCFATGYFSYEGYRLPAWGGSCGCGCEDDDDADGDDDDGEEPPPVGVVADFSKKVIFLENEYANTPSEVVPWYSDASSLCCTAWGGPNGGHVSISIVGDSNLIQLNGQTLPIERDLEPNETFGLTNTYKAVSESSGHEAIVVTANFEENDTDWSETSIAKATAVRVEVWPSLHALQNDCHYRRKVGVGEIINCKARPNVAGFHWQGGGGTVNGSGVDCQYVCPLFAENNRLKIIGDGCEYTPRTSVVEPNGVLASEVGFHTYVTQPGHAGGITLTMSLQALPLDVNFSGIMIEEIPDAEASREGYFADTYFMGEWYHGRGQGAGDWRNVMGDNVFLHDEAGFRFELLQLDARGFVSPGGTNGWIAGGMSWSVPCGWGSLGMEEYDDPIGSFATGAMQEFEIESSGNCEVRKHANVIRREITGRVILNGVEMP